MDDDWDNCSVASLAVPTSQSSETEDTTSNDISQSSDGALVLVRQKDRNVICVKRTFLFLLVAAGILLAGGVYFLAQTEDDEDDGEEQDDDDDDDDNKGILYAAVVGATFSVLIIVFLCYDVLISRRQSVVLDMAKRSKNIVDSLFPSMVRDRLMQDANDSSQRPEEIDGVVDFAKLTKMNTLANQRTKGSSDLPSGQSPSAVKQFLAANVLDGKGALNLNLPVEKSGGSPIADLYPSATVFFADIAGFTSWSAKREPTQVFTLLETVYGEFDQLADRLKVFKVETIGDCYMAVAGLPEPDENHAITMARFAYQCIIKMKTITEDLESVLGPGTSDLGIRVGFHSGPVTAGVLRGQKSRFQLFGDTVNTASRMESNGLPGKIHVSESTANLLIAAGKMHWLQEREDAITAKGKGKLRTFWLAPGRKRQYADSARSDDEGETPNHSLGGSEQDPTEVIQHIDASISADKAALKAAKKAAKKEKKASVAKTAAKKEKTAIVANTVSPYVPASPAETPQERKYRLIEHNTDVLLRYLAVVVTDRHSGTGGSRAVKLIEHSGESRELPSPYDSVADVIIFPSFDPYRNRKENADFSQLAAIRPLLLNYVTEVAAMYTDVPFHNFEHASHVTLAASKLMSRMVSMDGLDETEMYNATYGISADPLTHFAVVFGALIHDLGHIGVTNAQLVLEEDKMAAKFKGVSVAEQNSVNEGWRLLMDSRYDRLRSYIYKTNVERKRFRQVLTNTVMATDISDREINKIRSRKWDKAFKDTDERGTSNTMTHDEINRKATIVIENLIQVADLSHTMQHWDVYRKWNTRLFQEMTLAYIKGRLGVDPSLNWYKGEIGFFDFYVIPLAKKMNEAGVFGSAGDQYLAYATSNRNMWEASGVQAVGVLIEEAIVMETDDEDDDSTMESSIDIEPVEWRDWFL